MIKMEEKTKEQSAIRKSWNWLWNSNSILSWIVSLILAFIIVKFVFFPLISLALATKLPLVVVESSSMHHPGSFVGNAIGLQNSFEIWWNQAKDWYVNNGINEQDAEKWPLKTGLEKGDIVLVTGYGKPEIGDIIIFNANQQHPVIHRIIDIKTIDGQIVYSTKGDNNADQLIIEKDIPENAIIGKAAVRIPELGWIKLIFVDIINVFR